MKFVEPNILQVSQDDYDRLNAGCRLIITIRGEKNSLITLSMITDVNIIDKFSKYEIDARNQLLARIDLGDEVVEIYEFNKKGIESWGVTIQCNNT